MANYNVQPADLSGILTGLGSMQKSFRENKAEQVRKEKVEQGHKELMQAYQSNDPNQVASVMAKNPEAGKRLETMMNFRDKATKQNFLETTRNALQDPENATTYLDDRVNFLRQTGGDPTQTLQAIEIYNQNPEAALKQMSMTYAQLAPKQEFEAFQQQQGLGKDRFKAQEIDIKQQTLDLRRLENSARLEEQQLSRETNQLKRDELKLKIEEKRNKIDQGKIDIGQSAVANMAATTDTISSIDDFMANDDYIEAMSGYSGKLPTLTVGGTDAETAFNNIKNNLTLENLDKMSGVLSETDIKILSNAASRLEPGMSKGAMNKELKRIKTVLGRRQTKFQKDAERAGIDLTRPEVSAAPAQDLSNMTMEQLIEMRNQAK